MTKQTTIVVIGSLRVKIKSRGGGGGGGGGGGVKILLIVPNTYLDHCEMILIHGCSTLFTFNPCPAE